MEKQITIEEAKSKFSRCREVYKILIGDTEHQVWDIDGYEHEYGKWNNETPTYWIEMRGGIRSKYKGFGDMETRDEEHLEESREIGWFNHGDALWDGNIRWFRDAEETKEGPKSLPVAG